MKSLGLSRTFGVVVDSEIRKLKLESKFRIRMHLWIEIMWRSYEFHKTITTHFFISKGMVSANERNMQNWKNVKKCKDQQRLGVQRLNSVKRLIDVRQWSLLSRKFLAFQVSSLEFLVYTVNFTVSRVGTRLELLTSELNLSSSEKRFWWSRHLANVRLNFRKPRPNKPNRPTKPTDRTDHSRDRFQFGIIPK